MTFKNPSGKFALAFRYYYWLAFFVLVGFGDGCQVMQSKIHYITVVISNTSKQSFDWVNLEYGNRSIYAGIVIAGTEKAVLDAPWPDPPTEVVTFLDDETRKPYKVEVLFKDANQKINSGSCHQINIQILGPEKVEVVVE